MMTCHVCSRLISRCPVFVARPGICIHACLQAAAPRGPQAPVHTRTHRLCLCACVQVRGGSEPGSPSKFNGEINGEIGGDGREIGLGVRPPSAGAASQPASSIHSGGVGIESDSEEEREQELQEAQGVAQRGAQCGAQGGAQGGARREASPVRSGGLCSSSSCSDRPPDRSPDHRSPDRSPDHRTPYRSRSAGPQRVPAPASSAGVAALARVRSTRCSRSSS